MRPPGYISQASYALHCGVTPSAIHRRIAKGHLGDAVHRDGRRVWIDRDRADALFLHRGRPCNSKALQIENRLMAAVDLIAADLAKQPEDYCRVRLYDWLDHLLTSC